jgi:hypothetical protein
MARKAPIKPGDDDLYNDFEVDDEVLLRGGGGAHEESDEVDQDLGSSDGGEEGGRGGGESDNDDTDSDDSVKISQGGEEEAQKLSKKRAKLQELKVKKRLKVEQFAAAAPTSQAKLKQGKPKQLSVDEQFQIFMHNQPTTASGGLVAAIAQSSFFCPEVTSNNQNQNSFLRAIELGLGGGSKSKLAKPCDEMGCPQVLILCSGAKRATDVISAISKKIHCKISKLFAKHIKVTEQVEMLAKTHYPIACGTPNRVEKLLELGALCLRNTKLILVDSAEDAKQMTILSLPGVKEDFYKLMGNWVCKEEVKDPGRLRIILVPSE